MSTAKGNPEGRSFLRNAYRPWYMKKRLEELEGIGAERDLAGLPMARVPSDYLSAKKGTDKEKMLQAFKTMVRSVRRNEQDGIIIPRMVDPDTKMDMFDFSLLNSGGGRQFDINTIIRRYEEKKRHYETIEDSLLKHARKPAVTLDRHRLHIGANIEFTEEIASAVHHGTDGDLDILHRAIARRGDEGIHLHGFEGEQMLAFLHSLACLYIDSGHTA